MPGPLMVLVIAAALSLLGFLAAALFDSCAAVGAPVKQPAQAWVEAERGTHDALASRFQRYLDADFARELRGEAPVLPELERELVAELLEDWDFRIRAREPAAPLPEIPPAPAPEPAQ